MDCRTVYRCTKSSNTSSQLRLWSFTLPWGEMKSLWLNKTEKGLRNRKRLSRAGYIFSSLLPESPFFSTTTVKAGKRQSGVFFFWQIKYFVLQKNLHDLYTWTSFSGNICTGCCRFPFSWVSFSLHTVFILSLRLVKLKSSSSAAMCRGW